jgi:hypothetical protein
VYTPENELLVHVRSGDIATESERRGNCFMFNQPKLLMEVAKCFNSEIKTIKMVTAMHYGSNDDNGSYFFSEESYAKNIEILKGIARQVRDKFNVEVIFDCSDLDGVELIEHHFLKLIYAKNVVLDHGSFVKVIKRLREVTKG